MVPRLIHHLLLRLCAIIVSIVCSTVLTLFVRPLPHTHTHSLSFLCSRSFTHHLFYHSVSRCRQFSLFQFVCQSSFSCDQVGTIPGFQCIISDTSVAYTVLYHGSSTLKQEYIYMQLCISTSARYKPVNETTNLLYKKGIVWFSYSRFR